MAKVSDCALIPRACRPIGMMYRSIFQSARSAVVVEGIYWRIAPSFGAFVPQTDASRITSHLRSAMKTIARRYTRACPACGQRRNTGHAATEPYAEACRTSGSRTLSTNDPTLHRPKRYGLSQRLTMAEQQSTMSFRSLASPAVHFIITSPTGTLFLMRSGKAAVAILSWACSRPAPKSRIRRHVCSS
jgi:hypothetical protein